MRKFLLIFLLGLVSCVSAQENVGRMLYVQDPRTGLCYATFHPGQNYGAITNVPCTEIVLKAVEQDRIASSSMFR